MRYAKFEFQNGQVALARQCYERAVEELGEEGETVRTRGARTRTHPYAHAHTHTHTPRTHAHTHSHTHTHTPRAQAGHLDFINEIRPLTCIFLGFPSLLEEREGASHEEQVAAVQYTVQQVRPRAYVRVFCLSVHVCVGVHTCAGVRAGCALVRRRRGALPRHLPARMRRVRVVHGGLGRHRGPA